MASFLAFALLFFFYSFDDFYCPVVEQFIPHSLSLTFGEGLWKKKKKKSEDSQKPRMNEWGLTGKLSIAIEISCDANYSVAIDIR